ncbi:MAG: hypothetical protein IPN69_22480 [Acidobacteria bacterium]|nr:hypothetical protein [Acidobacteriota bacterium]
MFFNFKRNRALRIVHFSAFGIVQFCVFNVCAQTIEKCVKVDSTIRSMEQREMQTAKIIDFPNADKVIGFESIHAGGAVAFSNESIYKTSDNGASWKKLDFANESGYRLKTVRFLTEEIGLVVSESWNRGLREQRFTIRITTNGGRSWPSVYRRKSAQVADILVTANRISIVVNSFPPMYRQEIVSTSDNGRSWHVDRLELARFTGPQGDDFREPLSTIIAIDSNTTIVFSRFGRVFKGSTEREYREIAVPCEIPSNTSSGIDSRANIWMAYGSDGLEGPSGAFIRQVGDDIWERIDIPFAVSKAILWNDNTIVIGGKLVFADGGAGILLSNDGGRIWTLIFQDRAFGRIVSMVRMRDGSIWAAGENGGIVIVKVP